MRLPRVVSLGCALALLGGCVYYNGMYNTKRLAGSARKAERDGRTFEANNLWGQVINRADSLVTRHPDSKYVDEALVLKGVALARLNQCDAALAPLGRVTLLRPDADVVEEASVALGRCQLVSGDPATAEIMFARAVDSKDEARRREARLLRGRALRMIGRHEEALAALEGSTDPRAPVERLLALSDGQRRDAAIALADSMLAGKDTTIRWDTLVVAIGRQDAITASTLVDRLQRRPGSSADTRARLLLEDGTRLQGIDSARAQARLKQAADANGVEFSERARLLLDRLQLAKIGSTGELAGIAKDLTDRRAKGGTAAAEAGELLQTITRIQAAADSAAAGAAQSDLRLFLAGEAARDTLGAPRLAASLFRMVVESIPDSPYAPKAILAGQVLDPVWGESAVPLLEQRYSTSPYVAYLNGYEPYGYQELEDSLQVFALNQRPGQVRPGGRGAGRDSLQNRPGVRPRHGLEP